MQYKKQIIAKSPVRISFTGGGTDLPEYFEEFGGRVLSATIDKYIEVQIRHNPKLTDGILVDLKNYHKKLKFLKNNFRSKYNKPLNLVQKALNIVGVDSRIEISIASNVPVGSGLGTSSATMVALLGGLNIYIGKKFSKSKLAEDAVFLERNLLHLKGGWQDQYASSFGGINLIEFCREGRIIMQPLKLSMIIKKQLEKNLLLFYLKIRRSSHRQQERLINNINQNKNVLLSLHKLKDLCTKTQQVLMKGDLTKFAGYLHQSWELKKISNPFITNKKIDKIYQLALQNGALGGKLLGAGGGGYLLLFVPYDRHRNLKRALSQFGDNFINFHFEDKGFHYYEDKRSY